MLLVLLTLGLLLAATSGLLIYLLSAFPFDGLYGQDSYAYYYQARELWDGIWGTPPPDWPFVSEGLYHWPVGYHLHIMAGFLLTGESPTGGRLITLIMAALVPVLVAILTQAVWRKATQLQAVTAGVIAGIVMLLTGVYSRASLTLMADVPSIFWTTLGACCLLRAWPIDGSTREMDRRRIAWAISCGAALGISILGRYISALLVVPMILYIISWYWKRRRKSTGGLARKRFILPGIALLSGICALVPQLIYTLSQTVRPVDTSGAIIWQLGNFLRTTLSGPDGTATFMHPMAGFYFADPLFQVSAGFLSPLYLPALGLGIVALIRARSWGPLLLLAGWWLIPATFFSGGLYQAHRFIIMYLPPLAILIGIGAATALGSLVTAARTPRRPAGVILVLVNIALLASLAAGSIQSWRSTYRQAAELASIKAGELNIVEAAQRAVASERIPGQLKPKAVVFGISAALYHYTGWKILDIYNHGQEEIETFLAGDAPRLVVIPETSMATQWAGTPSGERWRWLRSHYNLIERESAGEYEIYLVEVR
jgi:4-amino-4-deoxy-L-arabinose transferase-like glycosyltransferase